MVNETIRYVEKMGWGRAIYDGAFPTIIAVLLVFYLLYRKNYAIPWWKALLTWVITIAGPVD